MTSWPRTDANLILVFEILLMGAFLLMNASDALLNSRGDSYYTVSFSNPISHFLIPFLDWTSSTTTSNNNNDNNDVFCNAIKMFFWPVFSVFMITL